MDLTKILLVTMLASGFVVVSSFQVANYPMELDREDHPESNKCGFCYYYSQTGRSPYEVLKKLGSEIRPYLASKMQALMLMSPDRLKLADYFFYNYCQEFCGEGNKQYKRKNRVAAVCQGEDGITSYEP